MNIIYFGTLFATSFAIKLPSYFPKCCINDPNINDCITEAGMKVKPFIKKGIKELEITQIFPIVLPTFNIDSLTKNVDSTSTTNHFNIYGMQNYTIANIEFNAKETTLKGQINFNELFVHCFYNIKAGRLLDVPIVGNGIFGGLLGPMNVSFVISANLVNKGGVQYAQLKDLQIQSDIKRFILQFQGLVEENGPWGNSNEVLRENGVAVGQAATDAYNHMFQTYLSSYLKWMLENVSYSDIFPC